MKKNRTREDLLKLGFWLLAFSGWGIWAYILWKTIIIGGDLGRITLVANYLGEMWFEFVLIHFFLVFIIIFGIFQIKRRLDLNE